jgi:hypothetical protein
MRIHASHSPNAPLLDIVDRKINALAHNAKDLCGIQRDETGRNGTKRDGTGSNRTELALNGTELASNGRKLAAKKARFSA